MKTGGTQCRLETLRKTHSNFPGIGKEKIENPDHLFGAHHLGDKKRNTSCYSGVLSKLKFRVFVSTSFFGFSDAEYV